MIQAAQAALQHPAPRRQIVPLHPASPGPSLAADLEVPRRQERAGRLLRPIRVRRRRGPHDKRAPARVPAALVLGFGPGEPHPALPAASDQALHGALRRPDRQGRLRRAGGGGAGLPGRAEPAGPAPPHRSHDSGERRARIRDGRSLSRPHQGARPYPDAPRHQPALDGRCRCGRHPRRGGPGLRAGLLLSVRARTTAIGRSFRATGPTTRPRRSSAPSLASSTVGGRRHPSFW